MTTFKDGTMVRLLTGGMCMTVTNRPMMPGADAGNMVWCESVIKGRLESGHFVKRHLISVGQNAIFRVDAPMPFAAPMGDLKQIGT